MEYTAFGSAANRFEPDLRSRCIMSSLGLKNCYNEIGELALWSVQLQLEPACNMRIVCSTVHQPHTAHAIAALTCVLRFKLVFSGLHRAVPITWALKTAHNANAVVITSEKFSACLSAGLKNLTPSTWRLAPNPSPFELSALLSLFLVPDLLHLMQRKNSWVNPRYATGISFPFCEPPVFPAGRV